MSDADFIPSEVKKLEAGAIDICLSRSSLTVLSKFLTSKPMLSIAEPLVANRVVDESVKLKFIPGTFVVVEILPRDRMDNWKAERYQSRRD